DRGGAGGAARIVPDGELTQEGERDYFKRTMSLSRPDVFIAPIPPDTNSDPSHVATPLLHIGIPLSAPDGRPFGIAVIDFNLGPKFERIRAEIAKDYLVAIVDAAGSYLLNSMPRDIP